MSSRGCPIVKRLHVSIVNYFKASKAVIAANCLPRTVGCYDVKMTVIDNSCCASNFRTLCEGLSDSNATLVRAMSNLGYVAATNLSVDWNADYILILNPDVVLSDRRTLEQVVQFLDSNPLVGVAGIKQVNPDGSQAEVARHFPTLWEQVKRRLSAVHPDHAEPLGPKSDPGDQGIAVDWLQSSFWVVRGSVWRALEGLDERFFLFMSDPDFCRRVWASGHEVRMLPRLTAEADGFRASRGGPLTVLRTRVGRAHVMDMLRYYVKYPSRPGNR